MASSSMFFMRRVLVDALDTACHPETRFACVDSHHIIWCEFGTLRIRVEEKRFNKTPVDLRHLHRLPSMKTSQALSDQRTP